MILFLDLVGGDFDGHSVHGPLGGSELAQIQLAEALAARGRDVRMITAKHISGTKPEEINGVTYGGSVDLRDVSHLVLARMTPKPPNWHGKTIVSLTDMGPHDVADCDTLVGVSSWQVNRFARVCPRARRVVVPPIVEAAPKLDYAHGYVYAGAAMKGLDETLDGWEEAGMHKNEDNTLAVIHGGWGEASAEQKKRMLALRVAFLGNQDPGTVRQVIAESSYLLGAKTYPETFCAVAAIAETCGTVPILYSPHGRTGLDEAIVTPVFYDRAKWIEAICNPPEPVSVQNRFSAAKIAQLWDKKVLT